MRKIIYNPVEEFEREFAKFVGANHAIACCNGTAALHTALLSVGLCPGNKVITTPFSFVASSNCILYCGAKPIFVDIKPDTYCLDPDLVEDVIGDNVAGIVAVHLFGNTCDLDPLVEICKDYDLFLVEDCAQALGAKYKRQHVGTFGDVGAFSFYATKNLHTFEGGMLVTNNVAVARFARIIINQGQDRKYRHVMLGYNYRMPWLLALIGLNQLRLHKKAILAELGSYGVEQGYYPCLIPHQPFYKQRRLHKGSWPNAEYAAKKAREHGSWDK